MVLQRFRPPRHLLVMASPAGGFSGLSDAELIRAARRDPAAFEALFVRHAGALRHWLFAQTGDADAAHDLLAETFAQAWRGRGRFRGEDDRAGTAWLYGIARNLLFGHYRRGRVETSGRKRLGIRTEIRDDGALDELQARIDARQLSHGVQEAFAGLTDEQRRAIGYRVIGELSYEEVAVQLDCTPATARSHVFRGLQTLRAALNKGVRA
jgi:RNA polymerase sigma-70 factor, ECF subfamily